MTLPGWTREPLVHFLIGGALVFAFFAWRGEEVDPASRVIDVDRETQAQIALGYERLMGRAPTDAELDMQIERYVREEVLYREALRLGLDSDDAIVRRRLSQKMDLIAAAQAEAATPSDETLQDWLETHPDRFARDARYSFDQLWFEEEAAAQEALTRLERGADWQGEGERISLPAGVDSEPRGELLDRFGEQFVRSLEPLEAGGTWQGPIASGLGWHLVRLREVQAGDVPPYEDIRDEVEDDWRAATVAARKQEAYELLRDAYRVEIAR